MRTGFGGEPVARAPSIRRRRCVAVDPRRDARAGARVLGTQAVARGESQQYSAVDRDHARSTSLAFTTVVALGTGLIFGLAPLLHGRPRRLAGDQGRRYPHDDERGRHRVRRGLVTVEIALAVMLVIGGGLLLRSFKISQQSMPALIPATGSRSASCCPAPNTATRSSERPFSSDLQQRLAQIPGVQGVASMQGLPPFRQVNANDVDIDGYQAAPNSKDPLENVDFYQTASAGYFEAMNIPIKDGRSFSASDAFGPPVAIINEALANRFFKGQNPIGKRINPYFVFPDTVWHTVIGVAKDVKQGGLEAAAGTEIYFNMEQLARVGKTQYNSMNVVLKSPRPAERSRRRFVR